MAAISQRIAARGDRIDERDEPRRAPSAIATISQAGQRDVGVGVVDAREDRLGR